jgi:hypothetical protein
MTLINKMVSVPGLIKAVIIACSAATFTYASAGNSNYEPPRNAQGNPNIQGTWDYRTLTPLERPQSLGDKAVFSAEEQEAFRKHVIEVSNVDNIRDKVEAAVDIEGAYNHFWYDFGTTMNEDRRTSLIVDPPNGRLPDLTAEALAELKNGPLRHYPVRDVISIGLANFVPVGPETLGLSERCLVSFSSGPPLIPSAYNNNIRIVQTPNHVVILTEMIHDARIVQMADVQPLPAELKKWTGASHGHWDGNTLVVTTTNFTDKTAIYQMPLSLIDPSRNGVVGSGENMELIERFTLANDSTLVYEYTIDAPGSFAKPFTVAIPMRATEDQIYEYACHEGNYGLVGMLKGARQTEKEKAEAAL